MIVRLLRRIAISWANVLLITRYVTVGKCHFPGVRERILGRQKSGKTRAGARKFTENYDITGDGQNLKKYRISGKFSPNIIVTWVTRVTR